MAKKKKKSAREAKKCVRTRKRYSLEVNLGKWLEMLEVLEDYASQKDYFLCQYGKSANVRACYNFREIRNSYVSAKYQSPYGLQARQWKLALKDSLETMDRHWASISARWREEICSNPSLSAKEKEYLLRVLSSRELLGRFLKNSESVRFPKIELTREEKKRCRRCLRRLLKKSGKAPRVRMRRSFLAEPETYRVFEHEGRQYISIMTKKPGKRVVVPLSGKAPISGQIRVVFDFEKQRIEIHHTIKSRVRQPDPEGKKIGIDLGITEVFTDSDGDRWGEKFGKTIARSSDEQKEKGKRRNQLRSRAEKHQNAGNRRKARNIERYNLGKKKLRRRHSRRKEELTRQVNEALNRFLAAKQPAKVVYEDLRHMRGKAKSKRLSRLVTAWIRSIIRSRLNFKVVSQGGSLLQAVNCAHSSRICPICGWVDSENRKGDSFECRFCRHTAESDSTAAWEILRRENDPEIRLWTHRTEVEKILRLRFRRRLETWDFPFDLSRVDQEVLCQFGIEVAEEFQAKQGMDRKKSRKSRSGQDSRTSRTIPPDRGGGGTPSTTRSQSESETLSSED